MQNASTMKTEEPVFCRASFNYVAGGGAGDATRPTAVPIFDGRRAALPGWETCGFELMLHTTALPNWNDDAEIERVHYPEVSAFARSLTGCDYALVSGHIKRDPEQAAKHPDLGPIEFVHSDFAESYGQRMRDFYRDGSNEAIRAMARSGISADVVAKARRIAIVQFWRNIGPAKMDRPIAFCDARTVTNGGASNPAGAQLCRRRVLLRNAGSGRAARSIHASLVYVPGDAARRSRRVPHLRQRSGTRGETFWTPHSAFSDPTVAPGRPSRRSIELRATCLFA